MFGVDSLRVWNVTENVWLSGPRSQKGTHFSRSANSLNLSVAKYTLPILCACHTDPTRYSHFLSSFPPRFCTSKVCPTFPWVLSAWSILCVVFVMEMMKLSVFSHWLNESQSRFTDRRTRQQTNIDATVYDGVYDGIFNFYLLLN